MNPPNEMKQSHWLRGRGTWFLGLFILGLACGLVFETDALKKVQWVSLDLRYQWRGPIHGGPKIVYIELDEASLDTARGRPIPLSYYAQAASDLFRYSKIKALGIAWVLDHNWTSHLVDPSLYKEDLQAFETLLTDKTPIVLASRYGLPQKNRNGQYSTGNKAYIWQQMPHETLLKHHPAIGFIHRDKRANPGPVAHFIPLSEDNAGKFQYPFALELYRLSLGQEGLSWEYRDRDTLELKTGAGESLLDVPMHRGQTRLAINWMDAYSDQWQISMQHLIEAGQQLSMLEDMDAKEQATFLQSLNPATRQSIERARKLFESLSGTTVIMGPSAFSFRDRSPTPFDFDPVPNLHMHGTLLKMLETQSFLRYVSPFMSVTITLLVGMICGFLLGIPSKEAIRYRMLAILMVLGYLFSSLQAFSSLGWVLPLIAPALSALLCGTWTFLFAYLFEEKAKQSLKTHFSRYVSPWVVERLSEANAQTLLQGQERPITLLFSDIASFSEFSESMSPKQLVSIMNRYFEQMSQIILRQQGTLDKYLGDAILAFFGAPLDLENHSEKACYAACEMQAIQSRLRNEWQGTRYPWPNPVLNMRTRISLHSGPAIVGNIGSSSRFNYTAMGDSVNLAARCDGIARKWGVSIVVTQSVYEAVPKDVFAFRWLDTLRVAGRKSPVKAYELVGLSKDLSSHAKDALRRYQDATQAIETRDWMKAQRLLEELQATHSGESSAENTVQASSDQAETKPSRDALSTTQASASPYPIAFLNPKPVQIWLERIAHYAKNPPALDPDGVFDQMDK